MIVGRKSEQGKERRGRRDWVNGVQEKRGGLHLPVSAASEFVNVVMRPHAFVGVRGMRSTACEVSEISGRTAGKCEGRRDVKTGGGERQRVRYRHPTRTLIWTAAAALSTRFRRRHHGQSHLPDHRLQRLCLLSHAHPPRRHARGLIFRPPCHSHTTTIRG